MDDRMTLGISPIFLKFVISHFETQAVFTKLSVPSYADVR